MREGIDVLSYDYPPNDGGISRLGAEIVRGLAGRGHDPRVLSLIPAASPNITRPVVDTVDVSRHRLLREAATLRWLLRRQRRSGVVLATLWNPEGTMAWLSRREYVVMAHGNEVMQYPAEPRFEARRVLRRLVLEGARRVVCNSRYTERLTLEAAPRAQTVVIHPGVDLERFRPPANGADPRALFDLPHDKRVVLSVARLASNKGHDVILRALAAMPGPLRTNLVYVIAGAGPHERALRHLAAALDVDRQVRWLGFVDDARLPALYGAADLFALCTREDARERGVEGFGMVFLEAQACGVPVLGTEAGGIPDAIEEGEGGWLTPPDDATGVRYHLEALARDAAPYRAAGRRGRLRAERVGSWEHYLDQLTPVLEIGS